MWSAPRMWVRGWDGRNEGQVGIYSRTLLGDTCRVYYGREGMCGMGMDGEMEGGGTQAEDGKISKQHCHQHNQDENGITYSRTPQ